MPAHFYCGRPTLLLQGEVVREISLKPEGGPGHRPLQCMFAKAHATLIPC